MAASRQIEKAHSETLKGTFGNSVRTNTQKLSDAKLFDLIARSVVGFTLQ